MRTHRTGRARHLDSAPPLDDAKGRAPDHASSFAADLVGASARSAEKWASSILTGAPRPVDWFVVLGWRVLLRLRLAPPGDLGAIAGWRVTTNRPDSVTLEVGSSLVTARKVLMVDADRLTLTTYVWFQGRRGRVVWSVLAPVHHRVEPLLISLAASRFLAGERP